MLMCGCCSESCILVQNLEMVARWAVPVGVAISAIFAFVAEPGGRRVLASLMIAAGISFLFLLQMPDFSHRTQLTNIPLYIIMVCQILSLVYFPAKRRVIELPMVLGVLLALSVLIVRDFIQIF